MHTFRVFNHSTRGYEAVKVGFSWPCLFFGVFWALLKRLWLLAGAIIGVLVLATVFELALTSGMSETSAAMTSMMLNLAFLVGWIVVTTRANEMRESNLRSRDYRMVTELQAENPDAAIAAASRPGSQPAQHTTGDSTGTPSTEVSL